MKTRGLKKLRPSPHGYDADMNFGSLAVRAPRSDASSEGFEASHLGLDRAPDVVSSPAHPERPAIVPRCAPNYKFCNNAYWNWAEPSQSS